MNDLALSRMPPTTLSREQRITNAKRVITSRISPAEASKAAKKLAGQFASLRAHDPDGFIWAVAAVLGKYPFGLVEECCDPQRGLALKIEFLSIKSLGEWCDERLVYYRALAVYKPVEKPVEAPDDPIMAERIGAMFTSLVATLRARTQESYAALTEKVWGKPQPWDGTISLELAERIRGKDST